MGQFKPMVKMMTTEPSIELKLKKGGAVKKADGGMMGAPMASTMPARGGMMPVARPKRPTMAARRAAMLGMKEGGESKGEHKAEMKALKGIKSELKSHEGKPASKAHKGLATGGVTKSTKPGEYATGGVVNGQGGFKKGGAIAKSGIINTEDQGGAYRNTKMDTAKPDNNSAPTGRAVAYPAKKKSAPVSNDRQSGTFKTGGKVTPAQKKEQSAFKAENATAMKQAKAQSNLKYKEGGSITDLSKGAYDKSIGPSEEDMSMAKAIRDIPTKLYEGAKSLFTSKDKDKPAGSVTKTEKSVTVSPAKKRGGSVKC